MSRTPNIGVVGVKHWAYMAAAMVECLDQIIKGQQGVKIPINVLRDALLFFRVVLEQETGTHFDNHLARSHALVLAWEILNDCPVLQSHTLGEADKRFRRFAKFLENSENQPTVPLGRGFGKQPVVPLSRGNQKTVTDLRDFFAALLRKDAREGRH